MIAFRSRIRQSSAASRDWYPPACGRVGRVSGIVGRRAAEGLMTPATLKLSFDKVLGCDFIKHFGLRLARLLEL